MSQPAGSGPACVVLVAMADVAFMVARLGVVEWIYLDYLRCAHTRSSSLRPTNESKDL
jgi:hypothetical protein